MINYIISWIILYPQPSGGDKIKKFSDTTGNRRLAFAYYQIRKESYELQFVKRKDGTWYTDCEKCPITISVNIDSFVVVPKLWIIIDGERYPLQYKQK